DIAKAGKKRGLLQRFLPDRGDVNILYRGMSRLFRTVKRGAFIETFVRNFCDANVRFAGIGVAFVLELCLGEDLKERSLAHLRQTDDDSFHEFPSVPLHDTCALKGLFDDNNWERGTQVTTA